MIRIGNSWGYTISESQELLKAIFPNYPELIPCNPIPPEVYPPSNCKFPKDLPRGR